MVYLHSIKVKGNMSGWFSQNMMRHERYRFIQIAEGLKEATIDQMDDRPTEKPTMNRILTVFLWFQVKRTILDWVFWMSVYKVKPVWCLRVGTRALSLRHTYSRDCDSGDSGLMSCFVFVFVCFCKEENDSSLRA